MIRNSQTVNALIMCLANIKIAKNMNKKYVETN